MRNNKIYDGSERKFGITYNNTDFIVKFSKEPLGAYSEYITSKFIRSIGVDCHNVALGMYNNEICVVLQDFTQGIGLHLHSYESINDSNINSSIEKGEYTYDDVISSIKAIKFMSENDKRLAQIAFWDMFICDAISGNRDRHWGNWGYLKGQGIYKPAPIYDNGSSLFPNVLKVFIEYLDKDTRKKFLYDRIYTFPASLFMIKKPDRPYRTNYAKMLSDLRFNTIMANEVYKFRNIGWITVFENMKNIVNPLNIDIFLKRFYIEIVTMRYRCIVCKDKLNKTYKELEDMF